MIINISKVDMTQRIKVVFLFIFLFLYPAILVVAEAEKGISVRLKDGRKEIASGYDNSYAVCIGINGYKYWSKLNCAVNDAEEVKKLLLESGFNEVKLLKDTEATKKGINDALSWLGKVAKKNDRVVIYFSGHGDTQKGSRGKQLGYIIPVNCPEKENYLVNAISMSTLHEVAQHIHAKHILYVMDSCYSGIALLAKGTDRGEFIAAMTEDPVIYMITAGKADEKAFEVSGHGVFTYYFLRGLKGEADTDKNEVITGTEIGAYTQKWVLQASTKNLNKQQTPHFGRIDGEGEFVFVPLERKIFEDRLDDLKEDEEPTLRSKHLEDLEEFDVEDLQNIEHEYKPKMIDLMPVVIDHSTGLMWQGSGSREPMKWKNAVKYVKKLNKRGHAGFSNWRLPSVEEAASLLVLDTDSKKGLLIDGVFICSFGNQNCPTRIWTGDKKNKNTIWHIDFFKGVIFDGPVVAVDRNIKIRVRAVRTME